MYIKDDTYNLLYIYSVSYFTFLYEIIYNYTNIL